MIPCRIPTVLITLLMASFHSLTTAAPAVSSVTGARPNILIIIADDMNYDSPGFLGGVAPDITPNLDRLARQGTRFDKSFVAVAVCQPSRQAMMSGKYPHNYGGAGFWPMAEGTPTVATRLKAAGYVTASFNKVWHMLPESSFPWDLKDLDEYENDEGKLIGRNPTLMGEATRDTIELARQKDAPFLLVVSSDDPHRPFHGDDEMLRRTHNLMAPSRVYTPEEVTVPHPLPDIPGIREDLAKYASSVRRLDDTVGRCLAVLEEEGVADNTIVVFFSDNGMPLPFGKFDTYQDSNLTPLLLRWPGRISAGAINQTHLVSMMDLAPTLIDVAGAQPLENIYGRSLWPLIQGEANVPWRDSIVALRNEEIYYGSIIARRAEGNPNFIPGLLEEGWVPRPEHTNKGTMSKRMEKRSINDGRFGYIYNHWFDPNKPKQAYPYPDASQRAMEKEAAAGHAQSAERIEFYTHRAQEEFYDWQDDPGSWKNRANDPAMAARVKSLQQDLLEWMQETGDPLIDDYRAFLADQ